MKQSCNELFPGSDIVRKYTFKTVNAPRGNFALLARANHQLSQDFADTRDNCALLAPPKTAIFALIGDSHAIFQHDCFECLSPHEIAA